jgi:hypothetical protein
LRERVAIRREPFDKLRANGLVLEFKIKQSRSW